MFTSKMIKSIVWTVGVYVVLLFVPAWTIYWTRAWIFIGISLILAVITMFVLTRANNGILEERYKSPIQKEQSPADKRIMVPFMASFFASIIFIPIDVFHLHLFTKPGTISYAGLALFIAGWYISVLTMKQNAFAAPVVKHQKERNHKVIDTGLYSVVRHPMYAATYLVMIGMALWLESYAAVLVSLVPMTLLAVRSIYEERFLKRELAGYDEYTGRVRYRLIPYVW